METIREIALRTYKDATKYGMQDTPMNWHIWKRAFDIAGSELKKLRVGDVSESVCKKCGVNFIPRLFKELTICDRCHDAFLAK